MVLVFALKLTGSLGEDRRCQARIEYHAPAKIGPKPSQRRRPDGAGAFIEGGRINDGVAAKKPRIIKVSPVDVRPFYRPGNKVNGCQGVYVTDDHDECKFTELVVNLKQLGVVFDGNPSQINPTQVNPVRTTPDLAIVDPLVLKNRLKSLIWLFGKE
jgi:hypothetical protein